MSSAAKRELATHQAVIKASLSRISAHKGVVGYMVLSPKDGHILESVGFNNNKEFVSLYAEKLHAFVSLTQSTVRSLDHTDELTFLRMRWRQREIIIAPDLNKEYCLIVIQDQAPEDGKDEAAAEASK